MILVCPEVSGLNCKDNKVMERDCVHNADLRRFLNEFCLGFEFPLLWRGARRVGWPSPDRRENPFLFLRKASRLRSG